MIIFVGQQPSKASQPAEALAGIAGRRLAKLIGIPYQRYLMHYRVNVNARFPGAKNGKGDGFDMLEGVGKAKELTDLTFDEDLIVLCGARGTRVFGLPYEPMKIVVLRGIKHLILPHPSGRNRYWNHPEHRNYCFALFRNEFSKLL